MLYRVTRTLPGTMPMLGAVTLCYGTVADRRHRLATVEMYLGIAPLDSKPHAFNALVTRVENINGITVAMPAPDGINGDRPWGETHTALANQEIRVVESRIQHYDERKTLDEEDRDARDFYQRLLRAIEALVVRS